MSQHFLGSLSDGQAVAMQYSNWLVIRQGWESTAWEFLHCIVGLSTVHKSLHYTWVSPLHAEWLYCMLSLSTACWVSPLHAESLHCTRILLLHIESLYCTPSLSATLESLLLCLATSIWRGSSTGPTSSLSSQPGPGSSCYLSSSPFLWMTSSSGLFSAPLADWIRAFRT